MTAPTRPPNVVLIIMDDLAWGDLACHGNPHTHTPCLDRLYAQSTRLTRYGSGPVCTPARASIMTGRYPYRTRAIDTYCGRSMIDPGERTLAHVLRNAGYATGISGKWHLGDCYPMRAMDLGFSEALVHNGGGLRQPGNVGHYEGRDTYFDPDLWHNGKLVPSKGYCTDVFTDHALAFIETHKDRPFFQYLATNAPHTPLEIGEQWTKHYRDLGLNDTFARLYGMVENIDHNVGRVLAKLDELQLSDDTIVIYTSDHGPCSSARHEGQSRWNAGLNNVKGTMYEGGLRVPSFWRWPRKFKAGTHIDAIANPIDVLPTLAAACGVTLPDDRAIDGVNLLPLLTGQVQQGDWPSRTLFYQWHRGDVPQPYRNAAAVTQQWKWTRSHEGKPDELYDLIHDGGEQANIAPAHPAIVKQLREAYEVWFEEVSTTRPDNYDPPRIVVGSEHERPTYLTREDWRVIGPDGWGDKHLGFWLVRVESAGTYRLTLQLPTLHQPTPVALNVAGEAWEETVTPGQAEVTFQFDLPAGDARVWPRLIHDDGTQTGVRQVVIERVGHGH